MNARRIILTGPREVGKTTRLNRLAARARQVGWELAGLITHPVLMGGERRELVLEDLRTQERRLLAVRNDGGDNAGYSTKMWRFDSEALCWGDSVLAQATPCQLLIIDELGKLELTRNLGFTTAFAALETQAYQLAVVVVRPELLHLAQGRWPDARVVTQRPWRQPATGW
jgi:nucleoside-triphosphatase THEP1